MADKKDVLAEKIVKILNTEAKLESVAFAVENGVDHQEVVGALKSLAGREVITLEQFDVNSTQLTPEGSTVRLQSYFFWPCTNSHPGSRQRRPGSPALGFID